MKIAVVGGGITGLSVALKLLLQGEKVSLYERGSRVGGLVSSFRIADTWIEKYFHHIFLSDKAVRKMISDVGLEKDLVWKTAPMGFYGNGKIFPFDGPLDLLRFGVLPIQDRLRFGGRVWKTGKMGDGLKLDNITAKEWVKSTWGGTIYENFWGPLLTSKFAHYADNISAAWLWGRIYARANSRSGGKEQLGYLRGSFIRLMEEMARTFQEKGGDLRVHQEVKQVEKTGTSKWKVSTSNLKDDYDVVVLALPSPYIATICPDLSAEERKIHEAIEYVAISCMPIVMDRPLSSIYWMNVGDRTIPFTGVIEQTNLVPKNEYGGMDVVYLFNYLPQKHPWLFEPKNQLFARYEEGLKRIFPDYRREQVKQIMLFRDPYANVVYERNYLGKRPPIASSQKGLFFANTSHIFPDDRNQNFSIELADQVVSEILNSGDTRLNPN